jgi:hypothetical protein
VRVLLLLTVLFCVVLFVAGVAAPRRSLRLQRWYDRVLRRGERKGDRNAGKLGDLTEKSLRASRRAGDASARSGRKVGEKLRPG